MLTVVVVDDEPPARRAMRRLIEEHGGIDLLGEAGSVPDAARLVEATQPDALFLDVEMMGQNGFHLLEHLPTKPLVVVVTAYPAHAVPAFDIEAVDFLLKPVLANRFASAIRRLHSALPATANSPPGSQRLTLQTHRGVQLVEAHQVAFLQAERDYTRVMLVHKPPLLVSRALSQFDAELPAPPFVRLSRSLILNVNHVSKVRTISRERTDVLLVGINTVLSLGRSASALLWRHLPETE